MMGLYISFILGTAFICFMIYKLIVVGITKTFAFIPDFFVVFFYGAYYSNEWISKPYLSGAWVYVVNILVALVMCIVYAFIMILLINKVPVVGKVLNFIIVTLGINVAIYVLLGLVAKPVTDILGMTWSTYKVIPFTANMNINIALQYLLAALIAIPTSKERLNFLEINN